MRNVGFTSLGGVRYGHVHQFRKDKELEKKIGILKNLGCTDIIVDIAGRSNLDALLAKVSFRDHIYFYDETVFRSLDEIFEMIDLSKGEDEGELGVNFDIYDHSFPPHHSEEATEKLRNRRLKTNAISRFLRKTDAVVSKLGL